VCVEGGSGFLVGGLTTRLRKLQSGLKMMAIMSVEALCGGMRDTGLDRLIQLWQHWECSSMSGRQIRLLGC
jgi:hypothetical protein